MDIAKNNMEKNASPDVVTYDDSRVKLVSEYCENYINASHVKVCNLYSSLSMFLNKICYKNVIF